MGLDLWDKEEFIHIDKLGSEFMSCLASGSARSWELDRLARLY